MPRFTKTLVAATVIALVTPGLAQAQAIRTWVSGVGSDDNACTRTAPCRTFSGAFHKTSAGGEISALDPGGFGPLKITKSITINGDGTLASIFISKVTGVTVEAASTDEVILRNISIQGGGGVQGILYTRARALIVDHVTITGTTGAGIRVDLGASGNLTVKDSTIEGGSSGIRAETTAGTLDVSIDNVHVHQAFYGVHALQIGTKVVIKNSTFGQNTVGVLAESNGTINLLDSKVSGNTRGVQAESGGLVRISGNLVFENNTGFTCGTGTISTGGDNRTAGNGAGCALTTGGIVVQ